MAASYRRTDAGPQAALTDGSDPAAPQAAPAMIDEVLIRPRNRWRAAGIKLIGELLATLRAGLGWTTASDGRKH